MPKKTISRIKKAVFPAAGLGTRFLPATKASPKEMLPIVDKPMIQYAVEEAQKCGINEFIVITGKSKRAIENHFDSAFELEETLKLKGKHAMLEEIRKLDNLHFAYIRQNAPLGLGHAIYCSKPFVNDEPFAVVLSDDIIDPDDDLLGKMIKLYDQYQSPILALQRMPKSEIHNYGVIAGKEIKKNLYKVTGMVEKPKPSDAPSDLAIIGRYILTSDIFKYIEKVKPGKGGEIQLTDAINAMLKKKPVYGFLFEGKRYDAGDKVGFLTATVELGLKNPAVKSDFKKYLLSILPKILKEKQ